MPASDQQLEEVVEDYRLSAKDRASESAYWASREMTLGDAVTRAVRSKTPWGHHGHQRRIGKGVYPACEGRLLTRVGDIERCSSFKELIDLVDRTLRIVKGAGPLMIYDVADRVGLHLGLRPDRVYLHAGTREGAVALNPGFRGRSSVELWELPEPLRGLEPSDVENLFCIYKDVLSGAKPLSIVSRSLCRQSKGGC